MSKCLFRWLSCLGSNPNTDTDRDIVLHLESMAGVYLVDLTVKVEVRIMIKTEDV